MNKLIKRLMVVLSLTALIGVILSVHTERAEALSNETVSVIVTAAGLHNNTPPVLTRDDVLVSREQERLPVVNVTPLQKQKAGLDLTILFDDSLESSFAAQLDDLAYFVRSLPPDTRVAVAYIRNSTFRMGQVVRLFSRASRLPIP